MRKFIYLTLGIFSVCIGIIGIFLPLLPTTPFLLLASYCFARSSTKLNAYLKNNKIYRYYAADYAKTKTITKKRKQSIIIQIYILMGISIYFAPIFLVKIALFLLTLFITYYLFFVIPNKKD